MLWTSGTYRSEGASKGIGNKENEKLMTLELESNSLHQVRMKYDWRFHGI